MPSSFASLFSSSASTIQASEIRKILELTRSGKVISFAGGLPYPNIFPVEDVASCTAAILEDRGRTALQYGPTRGEVELLDEIWKLMTDDLAMGPAGSCYSQENLLVTSGSQQGLDLLGKLLIDPGDTVVIGLPSYIGALQAFDSHRAKFHGVAIDDDGICPDALEAALKSLKQQGVTPKMIYTVPDFQNPTGVCLTLERRRQRIVELCREHQTVLVEDSPYRQVRFEGEHLAPIISLDDAQHTVTLHTFSKVMVPGLRIGWIVAHRELIDKLILLKQATDLCSPSFNQAIAAEYCRRGLLQSHLPQVIDVYREKRDRMLAALEAHLPEGEGISWTRPHGGLFLWVTLPERLDAQLLLLKAIDAGVAYVVGDAFHCDGSGRNTLRLNFSYPEPEEIETGIERLGRIFREAL